MVEAQEVAEPTQPRGGVVGLILPENRGVAMVFVDATENGIMVVVVVVVLA